MADFADKKQVVDEACLAAVQALTHSQDEGVHRAAMETFQQLSETSAR